MPLTVNLLHLEECEIHLKGEMPAEELTLDLNDEIVRVENPLRYDLEIQKLDDSLLAQGNFHLTLDCQCVRCLKPFQRPLDFNHWACHLPLAGDDRIVVTNDCVDLTPYLREDILLELPQHPLCRQECSGLPNSRSGKARKPNAGPDRQNASAWDELDKLKI